MTAKFSHCGNDDYELLKFIYSISHTEFSVTTDQHCAIRLHLTPLFPTSGLMKRNIWSITIYVAQFNAPKLHSLKYADTMLLNIGVTLHAKLANTNFSRQDFLPTVPQLLVYYQTVKIPDSSKVYKTTKNSLNVNIRASEITKSLGTRGRWIFAGFRYRSHAAGVLRWIVDWSGSWRPDWRRWWNVSCWRRSHWWSHHWHSDRQHSRRRWRHSHSYKHIHTHHMDPHIQKSQR